MPPFTDRESPELPEVVLLNRQRKVPFLMRSVRDFVCSALPLCISESADGQFALRSLPEVVVTILSDRRIDSLHRQFMNIAGATDVITFEHGEIVVSADTARRCAAEFGHSTEAELCLYIVHGLLHLNGFLDATEGQRAEMHWVQNRIWKYCLPFLAITESDKAT